MVDFVVAPPQRKQRHAMRVGRRLLLGAAICAVSAAAAPDLTTKHEAGRCAIRGHCGKQSLFGSELPCPDNGLAEEPSEDVRKSLVDICGEEWKDSKVCCKEEQVCRDLC